MADASSERASSSASPSTTSSGRPASSSTSVGSRTANTMAIRSASRRRATNASVCAEARSSHCASSTRHTSGSLLGRVGQQAQDRQGDEEAVRGGAVLQPERRPQRIALRAGQSVEPVEHRRAQLVQPGERELHLGLDARDPGDAALRGPLGDVLQQRGLADPRLAAQDQHRALPGPDALQLTVQHLALVASTSQHAALSLSDAGWGADWATRRGD